MEDPIEQKQLLEFFFLITAPQVEYVPGHKHHLPLTVYHFKPSALAEHQKTPEETVCAGLLLHNHF